MATNVIMPSLGFDMTEGKLSRWVKREGDKIEKGQAIAEIETEKATVEIEATVSGTLRAVMVPEGQTVPVGTVIGVIAEDGETGPAPTGTPGTSVPHPPEQAVPTSEKPAPSPAPAKSPKVEETETRVKASPIARRMAREAGIDLAQIAGSGPGGRIMERDVETAIGRPAPEAPRPQPAAPDRAPKPAPTAPGPRVEAGPLVQLNKMRQAIARRMTESKTTVPHFYVTFEINMTEALRLREQLNAMAADPEKISVNDLVIAAAARTLRQFTNLNASFHDSALENHDHINIGIAVALEDGLITPVLHDADQKSLRVIASEAKQLGERARANKLRADDLTGSTFTVSNLGMFGTDEFIAIINPPEAAILAVGGATKRPIVVDEQVKVAPMMKVTLSVDHRVADGAQAARYLAEFKKLLENPMNLLMSG